MAVVVPDDLVASSGLSEAELRRELALALFAGNRLTLGQAARLAGVSQAEMLDLLSARGIPVHYTVDDLHQDVTNLAKVFPE